MRLNLIATLSVVLALASFSGCSFEKKGEQPAEVPSAGTTEGEQAVQPTPPEAPAPAPEQPAAPQQ